MLNRSPLRKWLKVAKTLGVLTILGVLKSFEIFDVFVLGEQELALQLKKWKNPTKDSGACTVGMALLLARSAQLACSVNAVGLQGQCSRLAVSVQSVCS